MKWQTVLCGLLSLGGKTQTFSPNAGRKPPICIKKVDQRPFSKLSAQVPENFDENPDQGFSKDPSIPEELDNHLSPEQRKELAAIDTKIVEEMIKQFGPKPDPKDRELFENILLPYDIKGLTAQQVLEAFQKASKTFLELGGKRPDPKKLYEYEYQHFNDQDILELNEKGDEINQFIEHGGIEASKGNGTEASKGDGKKASKGNGKGMIDTAVEPSQHFIELPVIWDDDKDRKTSDPKGWHCIFFSNDQNEERDSFSKSIVEVDHDPNTKVKQLTEQIDRNTRIDLLSIPVIIREFPHYVEEYYTLTIGRATDTSPVFWNITKTD